MIFKPEHVGMSRADELAGILQECIARPAPTWRPPSKVKPCAMDLKLLKPQPLVKKALVVPVEAPRRSDRNAARATEERMQKAGMVPRQARPKVAPAADAPSKKEAQPATSTAKARTATPARSEPSAREEKGKSVSKRVKAVADKLGDVYRERNCQRNVAMQLFEALQSAVASERLYGAETINVDGYHELFRKDNGVYLRLRRGDDSVGVPAGTLKGGKVVALTAGLVSCVNQFVKKAYPDLPLHPPEFYDGAPTAGEALVTVKQMKLKLHQEALLRHGMTQTQLAERIAAHLEEVNKDEMGLADYEALINELAQAETEPIST